MYISFSTIHQGAENIIFEAVVSCFESQKLVFSCCRQNYSLSQILLAFEVASAKLEKAVDHVHVTKEGDTYDGIAVVRHNRIKWCC